MRAAVRTGAQAKPGKPDPWDWLVPNPPIVLPDGRRVDGALLSAMRAEWERIGGGLIYVDGKPRPWVRLVDDPYVIGARRPAGEAHDVAAVLHHATARAVTAGLREHGGRNRPGASLLLADVLLADAAAVVLAVLDRHLLGAADLTRWYLDTVCDRRHCRYHGDGDDVTDQQTGVCFEPLDLCSIPDLYWFAGRGAVEVEPSAWHDTVRRGSPGPFRLAGPATAGAQGGPAGAGADGVLLAIAGTPRFPSGRIAGEHGVGAGPDAPGQHRDRPRKSGA